MKIFIEIESRAEDGKFYDLSTMEELTEEEAIDVIIDYWDDMPADYFSWGLRKVYFKEG